MIFLQENFGLPDISEDFKNSLFGNWEDLSPILLTIAVTVFVLLVIVGIQRMWRKRRRHQLLFDDLATVHRLSKGERKFLAAAARAKGLEMPELIFVMRSAFEEHVALVQARSDWVGPLREKLYSGTPVQEEDVPAETVPEDEEPNESHSE
jgi:hypothetical protein